MKILSQLLSVADKEIEMANVVNNLKKRQVIEGFIK